MEKIVMTEFLERKQLYDAYSLANSQEKWAAENEFRSISLKTRKKHDEMIAFSLNRGFIITEETQIIPDEETRIWMQKSLNS